MQGCSCVLKRLKAEFTMKSCKFSRGEKSSAGVKVGYFFLRGSMKVDDYIVWVWLVSCF